MNALSSRLVGLASLLVFPIHGWAAQTDVAGPPGSGAFGTSVTVLPNGNFVVTDPFFDKSGPTVADVGAVYLFSPAGALINKKDCTGQSGGVSLRAQ